MSDIDLIKSMVEPLANKAGVFRGRVLNMVTEANVRDMYKAVGEKGIRDAAEAMIRIGSAEVPEDR